MSQIAQLLQAHSATKLLHGPTRHVCAGTNCGQAITGTMADHQADVLELAGYGQTIEARAEAFDEVKDRIDLGTPYMVHEKYVAGANWVRNQIDDVLLATNTQDGASE